MSDTSSNFSPAAGNNESVDSAILRLLMETVPDRIYFKDLESRFVRNNTAQARFLGAPSPEACIGKTDFDYFSREHAERALADEQIIIRTGRPVIGKIERLTMRDGTKAWASTTKMPWRDATGRIIGTFGLTRDVTATKEVEEKLIEERNLLRTIIDHLPSRIFVKDAEGRFLINNLAHLRGLGLERQEDARGHTTLDFHPGERGRQAAVDDRQVLSGGSPILNQEKSDFGTGGEQHWSLTTKVPIRDLRDNIIGLVGISHDITRRKKAEEELQRRTTEMETDLGMARQVQEAFLTRADPVFPRGVPADVSALRFAHRYIPTTTLGGDFFDIVQLSDTKCGVLICDVMGHGVRAGLLTALIRGVVEEMGERASDPGHVLAEVNHSLMPIVEQTGQPVFATVFFGVVDTVAGTLTYGNAGHPPPLVLHADSNTIAQLAPADPEPAAGLLASFAYTRRACKFHPGDLFLGYTDGLLEATDAAGRMFGQDGLCAHLSQCRGLPGAEVSDRLLRAVQSHSGSTAFEDDVCIVTIESMVGR